MFSRLKSIVFAMALLILMGCGGEAEKTAPPVSAPLPQPVPAAPRPVVKARPKPKPKSKGVTKKAEEENEPTTSRDFAIELEATNYSIEPSEKADEQQRYYVVAPEAREVATTYRIVPPDSDMSLRPNRNAPEVTLELPEGYESLPQFGVTSDGKPKRILHRETNYEFVLIPAGVFIRGSDNGPEEIQPAHSIYLSDYYIGIHEVTVDQFQEFRRHVEEAKTRYSTPQEPLNANTEGGTAVAGIAWRDALNFTEFYGMSLPTEAQWEKAARGDQGYAYPWGNGRPIWHRPRQFGEVSIIQEFQNDLGPYGVSDMSGNAREWVSDWYAADAYEKNTEADGTPLRDPVGPKRADITSHRVIKGGKSGWELWHRSSAPMRDRIQDVGFRCVLNLEE